MRRVSFQKSRSLPLSTTALGSVLGALAGALVGGCTTVAIVTPAATREAELALTSPLRAEARRLIAEYQARHWVPAGGNALGALANVLLSGGGGDPDARDGSRSGLLDRYLADKQSDQATKAAIRAAVEEDLRLALRAARTLNRAAETELKARDISPLWREELTDLERASFSIDRANLLFAGVREWLALPSAVANANGADSAGETVPLPGFTPAELTRIDIDRAHLRAEHDRAVALSEALALRGAQSEEGKSEPTKPPPVTPVSAPRPRAGR